LPQVVEPDPERTAAAEESILLARVAGGDRDAFRLLYARYSGPLLSFAVRLVGNIGEAEEQLQDAFVKIWRHSSSYDSRKARPFTWAVTILRRTCIDHLRKHRRLPATLPLPADETTVNGFSAGDTVRQAAESREDSERLRVALAVTPQNQRRALELALFSEMTHTEIARLLEQPVGTVKSWIRRGLLDLHATLTDPTP
jgi:RNA polymerase sigma-70 factor, ECF subfamily